MNRPYFACVQAWSTWETRPGMWTRSIGPSPTTWYAIEKSPLRAYWVFGGLMSREADDGTRTRYLELGKLALYQVSYVRSEAVILGGDPMVPVYPFWP